MKIRSLTNRLILLSMGWTIVSLAIILAFVVNDYHSNSERGFNELLQANLYNLMGSVQTSAVGKLQGHPDLGDPRFQSVNSGWYWSVEQVGQPENQIASGSLVDQNISRKDLPPFSNEFQRRYETTDIVGNSIQVIEARAFLGEGDRLYNFKVTGNKSGLQSDVNAFTQRIGWLFFLFSASLAVVSIVVVRVGLAPLKETTAKLTSIRNGEAELLDGEFPTEIKPLIDETNELIKSNRRVVERSRTQVGNLAHGLKTPIAVIQNEVGSGKMDGEVIAAQTRNMQGQIQNYLDRARISAQNSVAISRTPVKPVVEGIARVIRKLNPGLEISLDVEPEELVFSGEAHDLEELLGNLLENAARFAKGTIAVTARMEDENSFALAVADDGKGMSEAECKDALKRGTRLDESTPGSGLGLSIVRDIVGEYKGHIRLERSSLGGLLASVSLPART